MRGDNCTRPKTETKADWAQATMVFTRGPLEVHIAQRAASQAAWQQLVINGDATHLKARCQPMSNFIDKALSTAKWHSGRTNVRPNYKSLPVMRDLLKDFHEATRKTLKNALKCIDECPLPVDTEAKIEARAICVFDAVLPNLSCCLMAFDKGMKNLVSSAHLSVVDPTKEMKSRLTHGADLKIIVEKDECNTVTKEFTEGGKSTERIEATAKVQCCRQCLQPMHFMLRESGEGCAATKCGFNSLKDMERKPDFFKFNGTGGRRAKTISPILKAGWKTSRQLLAA